MNDLELYVDSRFLSPYAMSVFVVLHEKGLPFQCHGVDLDGGANLQPDYAAASLTARVPLLVEGDFRLSESSAIAEYLETRYPAPAYAAVYPQDEQRRARARQLQAWLRSDLLPLRQQRTTEVVFLRPSAVPLDSAGQQAAAKLVRVAEACLAPGAANLFGEWCIADTDLALMLLRLVNNGDPVPPALADYARQQWQRPSVQAWLALQQQAAN
ncbi:MAG: glutathione transferase [Vogesella sp.]|jgi:glutathione S-transferase|nr:glutathione transferase [Vogesella sp.]